MIEMTMAENNSTDLINPNPQQICIMNYAIFTYSSIKKEGISFLTAKNTNAENPCSAIGAGSTSWRDTLLCCIS